MSFVGTRPEVPKYVAYYSDIMMSTLLLPAGLTSPASIFYQDEGMLLRSAEHADETYVTKILPAKMRYNLQYLESFNPWNDIKIMGKTVLSVFAKDKGKMPEDRKADINV